MICVEKNNSGCPIFCLQTYYYCGYYDLNGKIKVFRSYGTA